MPHGEYKDGFLSLQTMLDEVCPLQSTDLQSMKRNMATLSSMALAKIQPLYDRVCLYDRKKKHQQYMENLRFLLDLLDEEVHILDLHSMKENIDSSVHRIKLLPLYHQICAYKSEREKTEIEECTQGKHVGVIEHTFT